MSGWLDLFRGFGQGLIRVLREELRELGRELVALGRRYSSSVGLILLGGVALLLAFAVAILAIVQLLALWMPQWAAALCVAGGLLVVGIGLGLVGRARLRSLETPGETVRRRFEDHLDWWDRLLPDARNEEERR